MNNDQFFIYLMNLEISTYLIRAIPFSLIRKKITNEYINSFLSYIPYTVLAAMTFLAALYVTGSIYSALGGLVVALDDLVVTGDLCDNGGIGRHATLRG